MWYTIYLNHRLTVERNLSMFAPTSTGAWCTIPLMSRRDRGGVWVNWLHKLIPTCFLERSSASPLRVRLMVVFDFSHRHKPGLDYYHTLARPLVVVIKLALGWSSPTGGGTVAVVFVVLVEQKWSFPRSLCGHNLCIQDSWLVCLVGRAVVVLLPFPGDGYGEGGQKKKKKRGHREFRYVRVCMQFQKAGIFRSLDAE